MIHIILVNDTSTDNINNICETRNDKKNSDNFVEINLSCFWDEISSAYMSLYVMMEK